MKTFTKVYWGIWALGLLLVIFKEINTVAGEGPGLMLFLYFGMTVCVALVYGLVVLATSYFSKK